MKKIKCICIIVYFVTQVAVRYLYLCISTKQHLFIYLVCITEMAHKTMTMNGQVHSANIEYNGTIFFGVHKDHTLHRAIELLVFCNSI